jgi:tRNA(Ile)-lysidine synthase
MNIASNSSRQFQQKVLGTIRNHHLIGQGEAVVVGVSGGPDSVCLLHVLRAISDVLDIRVHAIHINHMLRAEEADTDEAYVKELCRELDVPLSIERVNIAEMAEKAGISLEEAGREARYREFAAYAAEVGASGIAVAHNRNDQAETVMMHIIRGSGTAGLAGMEFRRGAVIRPLLDISRKEIEQYCRAAGLHPRIDSSNLKSDFTRNRVRLELFPYINERFGTDIVESLCRLSGHAADDSSYLEQCAAELYLSCIDPKGDAAGDAGSVHPAGSSTTGGTDGGGMRGDPSGTGICAGSTGATQNIGCDAMPEETGKRVGLSLKKLKDLPPAMLVRVLKRAVCEVMGNASGIGSVHYETLAGLISNGRTGRKAELPKGMRAAVSYGRLELFAGKRLAAKPADSFDISLAVPGTTFVPELQASVSAFLETVENVDNGRDLGYNALVQFFDYDRLRMGINIRNRQDGDVFKPFRSNGTKKLKEFFIDRKIPREQRDAIPLVCAGSEVVWVIGYKISDKFKVTENTKSVLKMEYNRRAFL